MNIDGLVRSLQRANESPDSPLLGDVPVVVSMTTHGPRINDVYLALESIARGTDRPSRLILWLDDDAVLSNLPEPLQRLKRRGLEVIKSKNFGPHTKYWPYVDRAEHAESPLITADDDVIVPRYWLRRLAKVARENSEQIVCYRAHEMTVLRDLTVAPYATWRECWTARPRLENFGTGVSGMLHPIRMQEALRARGAKFLEVAPRADDVWLHNIAVEESILTRQVFSWPLEFPLTPSSQVQGLFHENVDGGQNDKQITSTYSKNALAAIARAREASA